MKTNKTETNVMNPNENTSPNRWAKIAIILAIVAIAVSGGQFLRSRQSTPGQQAATVDSALLRIQKTGVLRVGWGGYPPYTSLDPNEADLNKRVKGFSVDLVNEIAKRNVPPLKVEWVNFSWDTLKADMASGKFDFIAEPVFQTVPRAMDFGLCEPYSYFGIAVAVVKKDDDRFKTFADLDRDDITISLAVGWTSSDFAQSHLTKPHFKFVTVENNAYAQCDDVLFGRADVALNDVPTVLQYVRAHSDKVKALWLDNPPSRVPGGFITRKEDTDLRDFLNNSVRILKADGVLEQLDQKWKTLGYFEHDQFTPGAGF